MIFTRDNLVFWLVVASFVGVVISCVSRPRGFRRTSSQYAFYLHQRVPNIVEDSEGASGQLKKPIRPGSEESDRLSTNYNPGIIFREEKGSEVANNMNKRKMSPRCMQKLNNLEKLVKQKWPGQKLVVVAAWDDNVTGMSKKHSHRFKSWELHYEGRAVDFKTQDDDKSKLGPLARLAVEAGFDWVYYVNKHHVHASVRSGDENESKLRGCFRNNSTVQVEGGKTKRLYQLSVGDKVQSVDENGRLIYSEVIMFIDRDANKNNVMYLVLETEKPRAKIYLTRSHLIYVKRRFSSKWEVQFARFVQVKDMVNVSVNGTLVTAEVTRVSVSPQNGIIAPLTTEGNIIVDGVLASCYAALDDQLFVDSLFLPAKMLYKYTPSLLNDKKTQQGVHWYARLLLFFNDYLKVLT